MRRRRSSTNKKIYSNGTRNADLLSTDNRPSPHYFNSYLRPLRRNTGQVSTPQEEYEDSSNRMTKPTIPSPAPMLHGSNHQSSLKDYVQANELSEKPLIKHSQVSLMDQIIARLPDQSSSSSITAKERQTFTLDFAANTHATGRQVVNELNPPTEPGTIKDSIKQSDDSQRGSMQIKQTPQSVHIRTRSNPTGREHTEATAANLNVNPDLLAFMRYLQSR